MVTNAQAERAEALMRRLRQLKNPPTVRHTGRWYGYLVRYYNTNPVVDALVNAVIDLENGPSERGVNGFPVAYIPEIEAIIRLCEAIDAEETEKASSEEVGRG